MKKVYVNFPNETIDVSPNFNKKASVYGSEEFNILRELMEKNPGFKVKIVAAKKNPNKQTYAKLTYANMRTYIEILDGETSTSIKKLETIMRVSKTQSSPYAFVKKWFLKNYPNYKDADIFAIDTAENEVAFEEDTNIMQISA